MNQRHRITLAIALSFACAGAADATDERCASIDLVFKNEGQVSSDAGSWQPGAQFLGRLYTIPGAPGATAVHLVLDVEKQLHEVSALGPDGNVLAARSFEISERCDSGWITHETEQRYSSDGTPMISRRATKMRVDASGELLVTKTSESQMVVLGIPARRSTSSEQYRFFPR